MIIRLKYHLLIALGTAVFMSCSPKNISTRYYFEHEKTLDSIELAYTKINRETPLSIGFTSKDLERLSVIIRTDTLNYIYNFEAGEKRLADTLEHYHIPVGETMALIRQMQSIRCTWVDNYNYYIDDKKHSLTFISIKPVAVQSPFASTRYYILTYFKQPQYFDSEGRLLERRKLRRLRKINGEIFKRINDKVCYTVSTRFR